MLVLGIETSCDETAAAVVEDGTRVRSSVVASQAALHAEYGGVVPEIASRAHLEHINPVVRSAVADAGVSLGDLDAIAVANRPGLIGALLVGVAAAKALAWSLERPLIGVDHVQAHLWAPFLTDGNAAPADPESALPAAGLVVSGGHTALYRAEAPGSAQVIGATIDDAAGEAFDKAAAMLGLGYPGGPEINRLAADPHADDRAANLPISRLKRSPLDFSFSGLKTALLYEIRGVPRPPREGGGFPRELTDLTPERRRDLAASFQRAVCDAIALKLAAALDGPLAGARSIIAGGGVTANTGLRARLAELARARDLPLHIPPTAYCVDNAAMIAGLGGVLINRGERHGLDLPASPASETAKP